MTGDRYSDIIAGAPKYDNDSTDDGTTDDGTTDDTEEISSTSSTKSIGGGGGLIK